MSEAWPAYREPERSTLLIDDRNSVAHDPWHERREAWNRFLPELADDA